VLRQVRAGRSLSLRQVTVRSGGRFKPSSVASYERGERQISLERLFALADVYDVAPERIVAAIAYRLERGRPGAERAVPQTVDVVDLFGPEPARRR
jgi:transcriptional regulator with XRE-family HTH domain